MKAVRPVIASNGVPCLQIRSVGSHSRSGRKKGKDSGRTAAEEQGVAESVDRYEIQDCEGD